MGVAFVPRHGPEHTIPPHRVPYKANLSALLSLGVKHVIATCVVGSLRREYEPGMMVVPDQFINLTWGRDDTFGQDGRFIHLPMGQPYCSSLSSSAGEAIAECGIPYRSAGTIVIIQGPRFSTVAESKMFALWGGDVVNMTQYPECYFARELGICYAVIASVTDYDVGVPSEIAMTGGNYDRVLGVFRRNVENTRRVLTGVLQKSIQFRKCECAQANVRTYYRK